MQPSLVVLGKEIDFVFFRGHLLLVFHSHFFHHFDKIYLVNEIFKWLNWIIYLAEKPDPYRKLWILFSHDSKRILRYSKFASRYRFKAVTFNSDFHKSFFETCRQAFESRRKIFDFFIADLTWKLIKLARKFTTKLNSSKVIYDIKKIYFEDRFMKEPIENVIIGARNFEIFFAISLE